MIRFGNISIDCGILRGPSFSFSLSLALAFSVAMQAMHAEVHLQHQQQQPPATLSSALAMLSGGGLVGQSPHAVTVQPFSCALRQVGAAMSSLMTAGNVMDEVYASHGSV